MTGEEVTQDVKAAGPARRARVVQVPVYILIVIVAGMVVTPILTIIASVRIADSRAEQTRVEQAALDRKVRADATRQTCVEFAQLIDVFDTAKTPVGHDVRDVYVFLYNLIKCHPPRK